ncbi:MAG TPA: cupin domain-containing protein [Ruminiclostridium sp.]
MCECKNFVSLDDIETQVFPWGILQWMSEPRITGTKNMATGLVTLSPGMGHDRHNHNNCEEVLYILKGKALQTIELENKKVQKEIGAGELVFIPADVFHSTLNVGQTELKFIAVYQFAGPEASLRSDPACTLIPALNK